MKERAAENVRAAHEAYGGKVALVWSIYTTTDSFIIDPLGDDDAETSGGETGSENEGVDEGEQDFSTDDVHTTVTIEPFDMDAAHQAALQHRAHLDESDEEEAEVEIKAKPRSRWQHQKRQQRGGYKNTNNRKKPYTKSKRPS